MVRKTKASKTTVKKVETVTKPKTTRKRRSKKMSKKETTQELVHEPVPEPVQVLETNTTTNDTTTNDTTNDTTTLTTNDTTTTLTTNDTTTLTTLDDEYKSILITLTNLMEITKTLKKEVRSLQSRTKRELKAASKTKRKSKKLRNSSGETGTKKSGISGFMRPTTISDEMSDFLGQTRGEQVSRIDVTNFINSYIKENNLQNPSDRRHILPDTKLQNLFSISSDTDFTYFNLQTYLKPHFPKTAV